MFVVCRITHAPISRGRTYGEPASSQPAIETAARSKRTCHQVYCSVTRTEMPFRLAPIMEAILSGEVLYSMIGSRDQARPAATNTKTALPARVCAVFVFRSNLLQLPRLSSL